jgi:hypothetical protein
MLNKIALFMGCTLFSATTFAGTSEIRASNNQISIQTISTTVDYTETGNGTLGTSTGTLDTESGEVPGSAVFLSTMTAVDNRYFEAQYDHSKGHTTYTGAFMGGTFGSVASNSTALLVNYSARFGKGFVIDKIGPETILDPFMLTPYVEVGRHKWDRGVNYGETYTNSYFTLGTLWQFSPAGSALVLSANVMLGTTFRSNIVVNSGPGLAGFSGALGKSTIYKGGLAADYAFAKHFHGNVGVEYTSFGYGMSAVYPAGAGFVQWEPDSRTNYTTLKLGLGYAF